MALDPEIRQRLLAIARAAFLHATTGAPLPPLDGVDAEASGVFVTIHCDGDLRGCLGSLDLAEPLGQEVARLSAAVGREDRRFAPIRPDEAARTHIELSVLTPPEPVEDVASIEVGRDGLIAEFGARRGLLLPQVATEHGWDRETFVAHTCLKAGLRRDAWLFGARLWRFEAEVFAEPLAS
ncbi:MAG: AmmeMemoRadiSam system protein A [Vicinamibacterales bacterium]